VAACAALRRVNIPLFNELLAVFDLAFFASRVNPIEIGYLGDRAKILFGIAVTLQAPTHAHGLIVLNNFHLIDFPVTFYARDAAVYVNGVIKINVVGSLVNSHPWQWFA